MIIKNHPSRYHQRREELMIKKYKSIFEDFVNALDEALETFNVFFTLGKDEKKPNQLLFCHIVNNFDSFINKIYKEIVSDNPELSKEYFKRKRKRHCRRNQYELFL